MTPLDEAVNHFRLIGEGSSGQKRLERKAKSLRKKAHLKLSRNYTGAPDWISKDYDGEGHMDEPESDASWDEHTKRGKASDKLRGLDKRRKEKAQSAQRRGERHGAGAAQGVPHRVTKERPQDYYRSPAKKETDWRLGKEGVAKAKSTQRREKALASREKLQTGKLPKGWKMVFGKPRKIS